MKCSKFFANSADLEEAYRDTLTRKTHCVAEFWTFRQASYLFGPVMRLDYEQALSGEVRYTLGAPVVFMRHEREEILSNGKKEKRRIFAVGYRATYEGGEIILGKNHETYEWVPLKTFKPEDYFTGGWLLGVKEYSQKINRL